MPRRCGQPAKASARRCHRRRAGMVGRRPQRHRKIDHARHAIGDADGIPASSSTGPCSTWSSRNALTEPGLAGRKRSRLRGRAPAAASPPKAAPSGSRASSSHSGSTSRPSPASRACRRSGLPPRPCSPPRSDGRAAVRHRGWQARIPAPPPRPACRRRRRPPARCRCGSRPSRRAPLVSPSRPKRLPAPSHETASPSRSMRPASQRRASMSASEKPVRLKPPVVVATEGVDAVEDGFHPVRVDLGGAGGGRSFVVGIQCFTSHAVLWRKDFAILARSASDPSAKIIHDKSLH
jgi:hypothetical protein